MPAQMRIVGWKAQGFRCPDHEVTFKDNNGDFFPVTLIQMPNGTGKTTTLTLLRAAFAGPSMTSSWDAKTIKEFRKRDGRVNVGEFRLSLQLNGRLFTIIMQFDFISGSVRYKTTVGGGLESRFEVPLDFRRFMNDKFVKFFVFDGELAQHLLDRNQIDAEQVVERLFQIDTLHMISERVADYWARKTQNSSATETKGLSRRANRVSELQLRLSFLEWAQEMEIQKQAELTQSVEKRKREYQEEIDKETERSMRFHEANLGLNNAKNRARELSMVVLDAMADPHALSVEIAEAIYGLKNGLDRVKLPESAAREFFEELAQEATCICGRPIDEEIQVIIRSRASQYLGSDDVSLLNIMKTSIDDAVGASRVEPAQKLQGLLRQLDEAVQDRLSAHNERDAIELEAESSDPAVQRVREEIDSLKKRLLAVSHSLERFADSDDSRRDDDTFGIAVIKRRLADAERKLAEITHTLELKQKRDELRKILETAHRNAKRQITAEICNEANRRILQLLPNNSIMIDRIDQCLILRGQEGGSVGEQLSIAYAFLSTLFNRAENQLPFVVDSPAGPIDLAVRPRIGELIPKLSQQFIAFTISSEREGFVAPLRRASSKIQLLTLFNKRDNELGEAAQSLSSTVKTPDGYLVDDERFFMDFQLETEAT